MPPSEAVEVWVADLDDVPDELLALLCAQERKRAAQIRDARSRRRWSASRAVLKDLLSRSTGAPPTKLKLELSAEGKPRLRDAATPRDRLPFEQVRFNLSHSGPLALYALSAEREVGVDVELAGRKGANPERELAIARRMLGEQVAARLGALAARQRHEEFLRAWVAHEAAVKCLGVGLGGAPNERLGADWARIDWAEVGCAEVEWPAANAPASAGDAVARSDAARRERIWVTPVQLAPRALGALAVQGGEVPVRRRVWEPLVRGEAFAEPM